MQARDAGIDIYSIGVGISVDMGELAAISGQSDRVYYAADYNSLLEMENEFAKATKVSFGPCPAEPARGMWIDADCTSSVNFFRCYEL